MGLLDDLYDNIQNENSKKSENSNRTKEGLPKLTRETLNAFRNEISREVAQGKFLEPILEKWCKELEEENPILLCYMQESASRYHPDIQGVTLFSLVMMYELLKSQMSNDKVFQYFNKVR